MVDENTWGMLMGKAGDLPGELDPALKELAKEQGRTPFQGDPQELYPDDLDTFIQKMEEKGWDRGEDDEELMEYAMHPPQYEEYKSGKAKENFLKDLEKKKAADQPTPQAPASPAPASSAPKQLHITVDGKRYEVAIDYPQNGGTSATPSAPDTSTAAPSANTPKDTGGTPVLAPLEGKFFLTKESSETPVKVGDQVEKGQTLAYIESMKVYNAITAEQNGEIAQIVATPGEEIEEDDVMFRLK